MGKWRIRENDEYADAVEDEDGCLIAGECLSDEIATQIVAEHNAHEELVDALDGLLEVAEVYLGSHVPSRLVAAKKALAQAGETNGD